MCSLTSFVLRYLRTSDERVQLFSLMPVFVGREAWTERGSVSAEFVCVMPAVLVTLAFCLGGIQIVGQQMNLAGSASSAARSLARGDQSSDVARRVSLIVGPLQLESAREGEFVCASLRQRVDVGPLARLGFVVKARNCALAG